MWPFCCRSCSFRLRGWIEPKFKWRLWLIFALGALQGAVGWWMVASGLVGRVDVALECMVIYLNTARPDPDCSRRTARLLARPPPFLRCAHARRPPRLAVTAAAMGCLVIHRTGVGWWPG